MDPIKEFVGVVVLHEPAQQCGAVWCVTYLFAREEYVLVVVKNRDRISPSPKIPI